MVLIGAHCCSVIQIILCSKRLFWFILHTCAPLSATLVLTMNQNYDTFTQSNQCKYRVQIHNETSGKYRLYIGSAGFLVGYVFGQSYVSYLNAL